MPLTERETLVLKRERVLHGAITALDDDKFDKVGAAVALLGPLNLAITQEDYHVRFTKEGGQ